MKLYKFFSTLDLINLERDFSPGRKRFGKLGFIEDKDRKVDEEAQSLVKSRDSRYVYTGN